MTVSSVVERESLLATTRPRRRTAVGGPAGTDRLTVVCSLEGGFTDLDNFGG